MNWSAAGSSQSSIAKIKDILKGKDSTILRLESRINALQVENEVLRTEQQQSKAEGQRDKERDAALSAALKRQVMALAKVSSTPRSSSEPTWICAISISA